MSGASVREPVPKGRQIMGRAVLPRVGRGYYGTLMICGYLYSIDISRLGNEVLAVVYDGPGDDKEETGT